MAEISYKYDSGDVRVLLSALAPKQWAFATALALTWTGGDVKRAEDVEMRSSIDRPTRYTLQSLRIERATPQRQQARVWFKDKEYGGQKGHPAGDFLMPQVHGGERKNKGFEQALLYNGYLHRGKQLVPAAGAPRDAYGNVSKPLYNRILSQLRSQRDPTANETAKSRKRNRNRAMGRYFYGNPQGRGWGVWERMRGGRVLGGRMQGGITPIFLERKPHVYRPRFAFFAVAEQTVEARLQGNFNKAAEHTVRTARR